MSICSMKAHQILAYIDMWGIIIAVIVSSFVSILLYRITTGFQREDEEYDRGFREGQLHPLDKGLMLGLTDYDAQRVEPTGFVATQRDRHPQSQLRPQLLQKRV